MSDLFWIIYFQPMERIIVIIILLVFLWSFFGIHECDKKRYFKNIWLLLNVTILTASVLSIYVFTLYNRIPGTYQVILRPFQSFSEAKENREMYRSMLMNVFLFVPLGLSLPNVFPRKRYFVVNMCLTIALGLALSVAVEWCQYRYSLGRCEVDDVIMNTLGVVIGSLSYVLASKLERSSNAS